MILRLLTTALCATGVVLLASSRPVRILVMAPAAAPSMGSTACGVEHVPPLAVVDVSAGVSPSGLGALIHLRPGEHITAVNDRALADEAADEAIIELAPRPGGFIDLTVSSEATERRVLLLLH